MQEVAARLRIEKLLKRLSTHNVVFELEATNLMQKFKLMGDTLILPLEISRTCTFIEKTYVGLSVLEIRDLSDKVIGVKVQNNKGEIYQITLLEKDKTIAIEYRIFCKDFDSILTVEEIKGQEQPHSNFCYIENKSPNSLLDGKEEILDKVDQMIEENDKEAVKIYKIQRKGF